MSLISEERRTIIVDAAGISTEGDFWQRYLDVVKPEGAQYFGRNLNAFWDAIDGGGPGFPGDVDLNFINISGLGRSFLISLENFASSASHIRITVQK
jgi:RNAse (barnase) inhibitor barstar